MSLPTARELKKLANACRKAGIKSLKCEGFEFTLTDSLPVKETRKGQAQVKQGEVPSPIDAAFEQDALTQDQLLMWSALPSDSGTSSTEQQ